MYKFPRLYALARFLEVSAFPCERWQSGSGEVLDWKKLIELSSQYDGTYAEYQMDSVTLDIYGHPFKEGEPVLLFKNTRNNPELP